MAVSSTLNTPAPPDARRWLAMSVFVLAIALSYLDRQILAALGPTIITEFHLTTTDFGFIISLFSIAYALSSPVAGWCIDRVGLNRGVSVSIGLWSLAGIATGFAGTFPLLLACRTALGVAESGTIPANGKAVALYLRPHERALGTGFAQTGISIGLIGAPVLAAGLAAVYGWRSAFVVSGALGVLWIPLWLTVTRRIPYTTLPAPERTGAVAELLHDRRVWSMIAANILAMTGYSLWTNWTTIFLVDTQGLSQQEANLRFAWMPPLVAAAGGLAGGALSSLLVRSGLALPTARIRAILVSAIALLVTAAAPHLPNASLATAAVSWSFFWSVAISVNIYALPLDYFGAGRAATAVSALTSAYGLMQTVLSPAIGEMVRNFGFSPVCAIIAICPLCAYGVLRTPSAACAQS